MVLLGDALSVEVILSARLTLKFRSTTRMPDFSATASRHQSLPLARLITSKARYAPRMFQHSEYSSLKKLFHTDNMPRAHVRPDGREANANTSTARPSKMGGRVISEFR